MNSRPDPPPIKTQPTECEQLAVGVRLLFFCCYRVVFTEFYGVYGRHTTSS